MQKNNAQGKGNKVVATQEVNQGIANKLASGKTIKVRTYGVNAEITVNEVGEIIHRGTDWFGEKYSLRVGYRLNCSIKLEYAGEIVNMKATIDLSNSEIWSTELRKHILGFAIRETILGQMYYEFIPDYRHKFYPEEGYYKVESRVKAA